MRFALIYEKNIVTYPHLVIFQEQERRRNAQAKKAKAVKKRQEKKGKKKSKKAAMVYSEEEDDISPTHAVDITHEEMPEVVHCIYRFRSVISVYSIYTVLS